jgi:archaetidylinositol phosphate synthase
MSNTDSGCDVTSMDDVASNQTYAHAFARIFVRPLIGTWVRPNHLTGLRLVIGLGACALLTAGTKSAVLWSGLLWVITCVLDRADGELARMGDLRSESGKVLDFYSDMILDATWFLCAGIGLARGRLGGAAIPLGVLTCASMFLIIWISELFDRLSTPDAKAWNGTERFHPDDALFLLAPLTWFGWLGPVLIGAAICTPLVAVVTVFRYVRLKRRLAV